MGNTVSNFITETLSHENSYYEFLEYIENFRKIGLIPINHRYTER